MSARTTHPRHRASRPFRLSAGGMLASASAVAAASLLAVLAAGGTYALWNDSRALPDATVYSGSPGLTVNDVASYALTGTNWSKLLPGDVVSREVTVKNTGTVPGTVSALTTGAYGPLLVHLEKGACLAMIGGVSSTASPTNLGIFAGGEASPVCVQVTLPDTAANTFQGSNQSFTVTFTSTTGS